MTTRETKMTPTVSIRAVIRRSPAIVGTAEQTSKTRSTDLHAVAAGATRKSWIALLTEVDMTRKTEMGPAHFRRRHNGCR
jgi:hypothetical protein